MIVTANGKPREIDAGMTLAALIDAFGWKPEQVVVERNGEPVARATVPEVVLADGDRLEIVRAVAGG